uniref:Conserved oligomeric Golgi complex subunit 5 n=1 Tax=Panstrongylus lignarius TaxID=156445 RepID=A0A224X7W7_9HEMI
MSSLDVLSSIKNDEFLRHFIWKLENPGEEFDAICHTISVSEQLSKLSNGIALLDKELQRQVLDKHEDLVSQATWVEKLQGVLSIMHIHVQSLVSSVERVRLKVVEPFTRLESQTQVLTRLHATTDLLRRVARIQQLVKRLPGLEPLRAAHIISELGELYRDVDLTGLEILDTEERLIKKETASVEQQASKIVEQGLQSLNEEQVAIGIEIMMKLDIAEKEVNKLMDKGLEHVEQSIKYALDMNNLVPLATRGGAGRVSGINIPANIQNFRNKLWSSWENALGTVYTISAQMSVIQVVLNNKVNCSGITANENNSDIASLFWNQIDDLLAKHLSSAAKGSSYMKQALEGEYPKLLRLHLDLHKKLKTLNPSDSKQIFPSMGKCVRQFETAYLSRSVMLVLDCVREMFPEGESLTSEPPSTDKVDAFIKTISSELSVSLVDQALAIPVARNVSKAVSLFCQKGEQMLVNTSDATQVIESPTVSQELNVNIANIINYMCEQTKGVLGNLGLSKNVTSSIDSALESGHLLTQQILNPLLASILVAIESILLTMHNEDYDIKEFNGSNSLYMRELQAFISRAVTSYLSPFHNQILVTQSCSEVASRTIELYIRNASLLRPLSECGRKKLLADFKSLEDAINPLCVHLSELGAVYSMLRSMRPLVTATPKEIASSPVLGQVIPYSLAITLLFSWGPPELPSPHQSVGWPISKLSEWLDNHPDEKDRLELLNGAFHKYEQHVYAENKSSFHDIYPIMKSLLATASKHLSLTKNC